MEEKDLIASAIALLLRNGFAVVKNKSAVAPKDGRFLVFSNINAGVSQAAIESRDEAIRAFLELCLPNSGEAK